MPRRRKTKTTAKAHIFDERQHELEQHNAGTRLLKLPPEIREQIWKLVLGGNCITLYYDWQADNFTHRTDRAIVNVAKMNKLLEPWTKHMDKLTIISNTNSNRQHRPRNDTGQRKEKPCGPPNVPDRVRKRKHVPNLSLLSTCRAIKQEAQLLVFSANNFEFSSADSMEAFITLLRRGKARNASSKLAAIRYIHIRESDWTRWRDLRRRMHRQLKGLRYMHLELYDDRTETQEAFRPQARAVAAELWKKSHQICRQVLVPEKRDFNLLLVHPATLWISDPAIETDKTVASLGEVVDLWD